MLSQAAWGEDFACDGPVDALAVRNWAQLAPGEAVRFFPALRASGEVVTPQVAERILARAAEIEGGARPARRTLETRENAQWLRSLVASSPARRSATPSSMARFAFLTGLHPAYVWPEAECLPAWGATAAWLGELTRRGRAIMPLDVAEYLLDVLALRDKGVVVADDTLAELMPDSRLASALLFAARRRLVGQTGPAAMPTETRVFRVMAPATPGLSKPCAFGRALGLSR